jgi:hypothetical protein
MNKTTILMFVAIAAFAVVGTAGISVAPAAAQFNDQSNNNQYNDQSSCLGGCANAQVQNNQQGSNSFSFGQN